MKTNSQSKPEGKAKAFIKSTNETIRLLLKGKISPLEAEERRTDALRKVAYGH